MSMPLEQLVAALSAMARRLRSVGLVELEVHCHPDDEALAGIAALELDLGDLERMTVTVRRDRGVQRGQVYLGAPA